MHLFHDRATSAWHWVLSEVRPPPAENVLLSECSRAIDWGMNTGENAFGQARSRRIGLSDPDSHMGLVAVSAGDSSIVLRLGESCALLHNSGKSTQPIRSVTCGLVSWTSPWNFDFDQFEGNAEK
jgi:hypothetical protein